MAECSYSSCIQEKRAIKKELQKWTKDLVYLVGLERVAEELMGRRRWRQYQAHILGATNLGEKATAWEKEQPAAADITAAEVHNNNNNNKETCVVKEEETEPAEHVQATTTTRTETPKDWQPEDRCYFCDGAVHTEPSRSPHPSESSQSSLDRDSPERSVSVSDTPPVSTLMPSFPHGGPAALSLESLSQMASSLAAMASMANPAAAAAAVAGNHAAQPALNPLFAPGLFPWYLSQALVKQQQQQQQQQEEQIPIIQASEQPLDLSAKSRGHPSDTSPLSLLDTSSLKVPNIDVKPIFRAKPRISTGAGRRTYTEEELQAALRDIQSGKLGTRRAAVIYGIPRSTLRNKVYKLERERERDHLLLQPVVVPPTATVATAVTEEMSAGEDEEHRSLSMEELVRCSGLDNLPATDSLRQLLQSRSEKNTSASAVASAAAAAAASTTGYPSHIEAGLAPYISQLLGANNATEHSNITELMKRMATNGTNGTTGGVSTENRVGGGGSSDDENVILRIPSFKPNGTESSEAPESVGSGSNSPIPNKNIGVSLREVITKSITQKFQQNPTPSISVVDPATLMANPLKRLAPPTTPTGLSPHQQNQLQQQQQDDKNKQQKSGKGTRPKRGKYRNYDRDSLIEAVRAVQRGEMSVHRAGSYYGVPHSTLEYKVKERHLMRPRKRDMNKSNEEKSSPKLHTTAPSIPTRTPPKLPPSNTFPPTPQLPNLAAMASLANGLKVPSGLYPPYQFWPNASPFMISPELYQEQLLASHMMQRAASGGKNEAPNITDRFFDGLIRSTLDRQPNAPEGISNRALLEQLCRGRQQQTVVDLSQEDEKNKEENDDEDDESDDEMNDTPEQVGTDISLGGEVCDSETAKEKDDSMSAEEKGTSEEQKTD